MIIRSRKIITEVANQTVVNKEENVKKEEFTSKRKAKKTTASIIDKKINVAEEKIEEIDLSEWLKEEE